MTALAAPPSRAQASLTCDRWELRVRMSVKAAHIIHKIYIYLLCTSNTRLIGDPSEQLELQSSLLT